MDKSAKATPLKKWNYPAMKKNSNFESNAKHEVRMAISKEAECQEDKFGAGVPNPAEPATSQGG